MKNLVPTLFAVFALALSSLACSAFGTDTSVENLRMAYDEVGENVTSTFSTTDIFFAVADLNNAAKGTAVRAVWTAVDVLDFEAGYEFQKQTLAIEDESYSGPIYFQLSNDDAWPTGRYRIDLYVNDSPAQSLEFNVE
jgi:hypothetical protein